VKINLRNTRSPSRNVSARTISGGSWVDGIGISVDVGVGLGDGVGIEPGVTLKYVSALPPLPIIAVIFNWPGDAEAGIVTLTLKLPLASG
jgi:hypothetical protein